ncbi:MAG: RAMP superfamily CRISPR-associated protein [Nitrospira sp.]|nr:RAMP superfamily CRISPR-associated protein [Nitrospira sp.]
MSAWTACRLVFTPLAPIHIGTGADYDPTNYVIEGEALYEFDAGALAEVLSADDRAALSQLTERRPDDAMLRAIQKFFYDRRFRLALAAQRRLPVQPGVATLYQQRVGQIAQQESRGRRVINQLAISRTAWNPVTGWPFLPGSSVKGSIRTALLDQVNNGAPPLPHERKGLHEFQGRLFRYAEPREEGRWKIALERDPLRLIQLADAVWQGPPDLPATEIAFAVNKPKASTGSSPGSRPTTDSILIQWLECLSPFHYRAFAGQLNVQLLGNVTPPGKVPVEELRFGLQQIAQACNQFYRPILERELALLRSRGWIDRAWDQTITALLNLEHLTQGHAFLLRVGRHSGAESVTVNGARRILIRQGRGQPSKEAAEATTIWLAAKERNQETGLLPFGWLLVEYGPLDHEPLPDLVPLKQACERRLGPVRQWVQRVRTQQAEWRRKGLTPSSLPTRPTTAVSASTHCPWVDDKLAELCSKPGIKPDDALRGSALAEAVRGIEDATLRAQALADIVARWKEKGWWDNTTGGAAKKAKAIYEELLKA